MALFVCGTKKTIHTSSQYHTLTKLVESALFKFHPAQNLIDLHFEKQKIPRRITLVKNILACCIFPLFNYKRLLSGLAAPADGCAAAREGHNLHSARLHRLQRRQPRAHGRAGPSHTCHLISRPPPPRPHLWANMLKY